MSRLDKLAREEERAFELFVLNFRNAVRAWNRYVKARKRGERAEKRAGEELELEEVANG